MRRSFALVAALVGITCLAAHNESRLAHADAARPLPRTDPGASLAPERLAAALASTGSLVVEGGFAYFVDWGHASSVPTTAGSHPPRVLEQIPRWGELVTTDWQIVADGGFLYATTEAGMVYRVPKTGGHATRVGTYAEGVPERSGYLALDGAFVYVTHLAGNTVKRVAKGGGRVDTLYTDAEHREPGPIAVDARAVYWVNQVDGSLFRLPKAGGAPVLLGHGLGRSFGLALDGAHAYFTDYDGGRVLSVPLEGGETVVVADHLGAPAHLALDGDFVYFGDTERGTIAVVRKDGAGGPRVIASGQSMPASLAVAGDYLYWVAVATGDSDGTLMRVRKPAH